MCLVPHRSLPPTPCRVELTQEQDGERKQDIENRNGEILQHSQFTKAQFRGHLKKYQDGKKDKDAL